MNKRETLEICEKGWLELAETGATDKPTMFANFDCECPCCEYDLRQGRNTCMDCPISWPTGHCTRHGSPYMEWLNAHSPKKRRVYATQVAALAREELDKMEEANLDN